MRLFVSTLSLGILIACSTGFAQTPAGQRDCPQNTGTSGPTPPAPAAKASDGTEKPEQQGTERSAILPSAGQHEQSAAPTVQQNGKDVVADADCPKPPNKLK